MAWAILAAMCLACVELLQRLDPLRHLRATLTLSREALAVLRSGEMTDEQKEVALRSGSLALMKQTLLFAAKFALAAAGAGLVYLAGVHLLRVPAGRLDDLLLMPWVWLGMTVLSLLYLRVRNVLSRRL